MNKRVFIDQNSDCYMEIELLKDLLKKSRHYCTPDGEWTDAQVVAVAIDELFDKLQAEARNERS